ncbi:uncharacterized protein LOC130672841 [Microplitis mediator]|uniref:uncharacterized protein LOC130672841 n=1 Tax=Microplitis mediator TaxID=375433 RepID=UPI002553142D|nr:uncharacterized protein LOC130672841 [Microplitis mediator]
MVKLKLIFLIFVIINCHQSNASVNLSTMNEIGGRIKDIVVTISNVVAGFKKKQSSLNQPISGNHSSNPILPDKYPKHPLDHQVDLTNNFIAEENHNASNANKAMRKMFFKARLISNNLFHDTDGIEKQLGEHIRNIFLKLGTNCSESKISEIHDCVFKINEYYKYFMVYAHPKVQITISEISKFVNSILSIGPDSLLEAVINLKSFFEPSNSAPIYLELLKYLRNPQVSSFGFKCDNEMSIQEEIKAVYDLVILTELKAFTMIVFAHKYQELMLHVDEKDELNVEITQLVHRMSNYLQGSKRITSLASRETLRCDPETHYHDVTSFRLDNLFGLYYLNKRQLDANCEASHTNRSTKIVNQDIKRDILSSVECLDESYNRKNLLINNYCPKWKCNGRLHDCTVAEKKAFCEAKLGTGRRYEWIDNGSKKTVRENCNGRYIDTLEQASCDNLICQCSEEGAESFATRAISLMPQIADINNNMVITNVRFQKKDNMVHLQAEQGRLMPGGKIDNFTRNWIPLNDLVYKQNTADGSFWKREGNVQSPLIYELDYTYLRHDNIKLHLDDVITSPDTIVTGVRLNYMAGYPSNFSSPLELQIFVTPYDYYRGTLEPRSSKPSMWLTTGRSSEKSADYFRMRTELNLSHSDDPLKADTKNHLDSYPNQFIKFQVTDYQKDFGQLTIPYFDARPAAILGDKALSGIGLAHRGSKGYGGFLVPKLINADHSQYINFTLTQQQIDDFKRH